MIKKRTLFYRFVSTVLSVFFSAGLPYVARSRRFPPLAFAVLVFLSLLAPAGLDAAGESIYNDTVVQGSIELFAAAGKPSNALIDNILRQVNISNERGKQQLADAIKAVEGRFPQKAGVLEGQLHLALDRRRMDLVNSILAEVARDHNLDAIVRTGSSGLRFLNPDPPPPSDVYRLLFSDDDISFIGKDALAARNSFNRLVSEAGLGNAKIGGFTINDLRARGYDTIGLELLDPEKYVGKSALQQIKGDMYRKGAVVYQRNAAGGPLQLSRQPLAEFVVTRRDTMLSQYVGDAFRDNATKRFGALTAVSSSEREIAYKTWDALDDAEKVKYVERELKALNTSGGLKYIAGMDNDAIEAQFEKLIEMKMKKTLSEAQKQLLIEMRAKNVKLSLLEIPQKIDAIVGAVGFEATEGRVLAANTAVREAIEEFATGFALLNQSRSALKIDPDAFVEEMLKRFPKGSDIYKVLYTAHMQGKDLLEALRAYTKGGLWNPAAQEAFLRDLKKLTTNEAKAALAETTERKVAKAATKEELSVLQGIREMYKNALGGTFLDKLIRHPTGHKVALGLLVATGGRYLLNEMYQSWARGSVKDDLTDCTWALVKFAPGVMTVEKAVAQGLSADTAISFVKDVMYFSPYWPIALMMDVAQVTVEIGSAMSLQNYQEGMIEILAVNGEFDPSGRFVGLRLLNGQDRPGELIPREEMAAFFTGQPGGVYPENYKGDLFSSRKVRVFNTNLKERGVAFTTVLGKAAGELYTKFYLPNDSVLNKLTKAYEDQRRFINTRESIGSLGDFEWGRAASSHFNWLMGWESVCAKSPQTWCEVLGVLQWNMKRRQRHVVPEFMVPHMILMAEELYKTLEAPTALKDKLIDLQKKFEALRDGKELEVKLDEMIKAEADRLAQSGGDSGKKKVTRGEYWQKAVDIYQRMYDGTKNLKAEILRDTEFDRAQILRFPWSGNPLQDTLREGVSRSSFRAAKYRITADITGFKKAKPDPADSVDKQAFEILGSVLFPWMMAMDTTTTLAPTGEGLRIIPEHQLPPGSNYDEEYKQALEKVEALYKEKGDFQTLLREGAKIVPADPALMMGRGGGMALVFSDEELKKDLAAKRFTFKWSASPKGTFTPNDYDQEVIFTSPDPGSVTINVRVERSVPKEKKLNASLTITLPVKAPDNFVRLELIPAAPKPEEKGRADTTLDQLRFIDKLKYKWSGTNCQVEDVDRLSTSVIAPKAGQAAVTVELSIKDAAGDWVSFITKQVSFSVDGKPGDKAKDDPKDDKKDGQKPPPQVQPGSYTQPSDQPGVQSGPNDQTGTTSSVSGQTGVPSGPSSQTGTTSGVTGQTGVQGGPSGQTGVQGGPSGQTGTTSGVNSGIGVGATPTPPTPPKEPPACTYEYSAWGECNRGTKKQFRTVMAKRPPGCVEKDKPRLEQGCNPPPTEEEKRLKYLSCACNCYGGWAPPLGSFYSPSGYPECVGSGPCVGGLGALGACRRNFIGAPNDCSKGCYEGIYGKGSYNEKTANQIRKDVNRKSKKPLRLQINEGKCPLTAQLGDIINLTASAEGGIPPYTFSWSGNGQAKDNTFIFANTRQPGTHPISVTVSDDDGGSATGTCAIIVEAMTVKIELLDKEKKIPISESRSFRGTVMSGDKPARGDFYFLWQPHPEIEFSPFEKTGGSVSGTKAKFNKLGNFKVWVVAHTYKGNIKTTVGESDQIQIEVSKPELKLSFQPQNPKVGQEVKLTVTETPKMTDKAISFWWEIAGNTLNAGPLKNEREYTFRPKDTKPVTVTVHGKAKEGGDDLGEDKATITAQGYKVSLSEPQHRSPKPRIWKCDTQFGKAKDCGIVELAKELAVFNDIFVKASVDPAPEKTPLRYNWSIEPTGVCGLPGGGQELKLNCSQPGNYTVVVKVRDSQDIDLGTAGTQVNITVTKDDIDKGKKHLVSLQSDKNTLKTGETANIKAVVQGGKPPYSYQWGPGLVGKGESVRFIPKKSGQQKIAVNVTDKSGAKSSASLEIKVEAAKLEVSLKPDKALIKTGETVSVKAAVKGGEPEFSYKWSAGVEGKGQSARFTPRKSGTQKIALEVTDGKGQKATAGVDITVEPRKLEVQLTTDKAKIKTGETVNLKAAVKGGEPPFAYKWSEGVMGKEESARLTPKKSGTQKVNLEITDSAKQKVTAGVDIKVEPLKIKVTLKANKSKIETGETVDLTADVKGGEPPLTYKWSEGVEGKEASAGFTPKKSGNQKVVLEITDSAKQKATASVDIKVKAPKLELALTADKASMTVGETAKVSAEVKGGEPPFTYQWSGGVEFVSKSANFKASSTYTPKKSGTQKVALKITDAVKQKATASVDIKVKALQDGQKPQAGTDDLPVVRPVDPAKKIAIEPENLTLTVGETQTLQVFQVLPDGSKNPYTQGKAAWTGAPYQGIVIDGNGKINVTSLAKIGSRVKITAQDGPLKAEAWVEVVSSPKTTGQPLAGPAAPSTPATSTILASDSPTSTRPIPASVPTLTIEPKNLLISSGKSADLKVYTVQNGRKVADVTGQCTILVSPDTGIRIDRNGHVTVEKTARPGIVEPVLATLKHISGVTLRADGIIRIEGSAKISSYVYDPRNDPGKLSTMKPGDLDKVNKIAGDFQTGQWKPTDTKQQKIKDQQPGQPQPQEYLSSSTTTTMTTIPPVSTSTPTTASSGGTTIPTTVHKGSTTPPTTAKPSTTTVGVTPKDLTDVTVDRRDVTITVWDHGTEDGDIITIYLNGKVLKSRLKLTKKKQSFQVNLTGGQNRFEVEAVNEGSQSPNTATVEISNVTKGKPIQVYARKTGQRANMNLIAP